MNEQLAIRNNASAIESLIAQGDLDKLTPQQRTDFYFKVCESLGLNPLTQPFEYIKLNGKLRLYARKDCTDQLRSIHDISVIDMREDERDGVFVVTTKVQNAKGRTDIAKGAVSISGLKGENLANALMKAETKAKRRATLSICGLGFLDEVELDTIPARAKESAEPDLPSPKPTALPAHDPVTGETGPREIPVPAANGVNPSIAWGQLFLSVINAAKTWAEIDEWCKKNDAYLQAVRDSHPKVYERIRANIDAAVSKLPVSAEVPLPEDPEEFRSYVEKRFLEAKSEAECREVANKTFMPSYILNRILPPDLEDLQNLLELHLRRFEA